MGKRNASAEAKASGPEMLSPGGFSNTQYDMQVDVIRYTGIEMFVKGFAWILVVAEHPLFG